MEPISVVWDEFKAFVDARSLSVQYLELAGMYELYAIDGPFALRCAVVKEETAPAESDQEDFENNYKPAGNAKIDKRTPEQGITKVAVHKGEGTDFSRASHDWTDKTTWYSGSQRVTAEVLSSPTGTTYNLANSNIIDLTHGKVSDEDSIASAYSIIVYDDGVPISNVTVDYGLGTVTLPSAASGTVTADYSYADKSTYTLAPTAGKVLYLEHAEIQFSSNVDMSQIEFQIWAYNPYDLPNKVMVQNKIYKNEKDILNSANLGQGKIQAFGALTQDVLVFPFNYVYLKPLKSSQGVELRIVTKDDAAFTGEFSTITFYCFSEDE